MCHAALHNCLSVSCGASMVGSPPSVVLTHSAVEMVKVTDILKGAI